MVDLTEKDISEFILKSGRPIPGQSLTNNPETPAPYEKPPQFTTKEEAMDHFFNVVTEEKRFDAIMESLAEDFPVMDMVQLLLTKSFQDGEINPDMMLLLAEPLAYLLIGLAEREGIRVVIVDAPEDSPNEENNAQSLGLDISNISPDTFRDKLQTITSPQEDKELNIQDKIKGLPSLMARGD